MCSIFIDYLDYYDIIKFQLFEFNCFNNKIFLYNNISKLINFYDL